MGNPAKQNLLQGLTDQFGQYQKLPNSQSLYTFGNGELCFYLRYSKVHPGERTFFGLRVTDLRQLSGRNGFICLFTDVDITPVCIPFIAFEEVFHGSEPASDGQYKVQLFGSGGTKEIYIARRGRFNVDAYYGYDSVHQSLRHQQFRPSVDLSHQQVQTLLGGIGHAKGFDVYVPRNDVVGLDWNLTTRFQLRETVPEGYGDAQVILQEIDVVWLTPGRNEIQGLLEVEHSTPIYSGLLRMNDLLLTQPNLNRFLIVSNDSRRDLFSRKVVRPTFRRSGLGEIVSFLDYDNVAVWHTKLTRVGNEEQ